MFHVVLVEPEIQQNTGNIARTCLTAGEIDAGALRRAGMDCSKVFLNVSVTPSTPLTGRW